jgi:hypothetical protein
VFAGLFVFMGLSVKGVQRLFSHGLPT